MVKHHSGLPRGTIELWGPEKLRPWLPDKHTVTEFTVEDDLTGWQYCDDRNTVEACRYILKLGCPPQFHALTAHIDTGLTDAEVKVMAGGGTSTVGIGLLFVRVYKTHLSKFSWAFTTWLKAIAEKDWERTPYFCNTTPETLCFLHWLSEFDLKAFIAKARPGNDSRSCNFWKSDAWSLDSHCKLIPELWSDQDSNPSIVWQFCKEHDLLERFRTSFKRRAYRAEHFKLLGTAPTIKSLQDALKRNHTPAVQYNLSQLPEAAKDLGPLLLTCVQFHACESFDIVAKLNTNPALQPRIQELHGLIAQMEEDGCTA
jgi:hypothetical protein